jgi:ribonuclease HIII
MRNNEAKVGVDESGKGDYFGPLVIAACAVGPEHLAELEGVKDSKKLTDDAALKIAVRIKAVCPHSIIAIGPEKYNELYSKMRNLNHLLAWGHAQAIENVLENYAAPMVISDQFAAGGNVVRARLKERGKAATFISRVRAEEDIAVAAASILARAAFLQKLKLLSEEYGIQLPKGATNVIETGKVFIQKHGTASLAKVAKLHFKTTQQVIQ